MIYLQVILTIFSILLLTTIILGVIWWKRYGKPLFFLIKTENPMKITTLPNFINQNPMEIMKNLDKLMKNMDPNEFYRSKNNKKGN